MTFIYYYTPSDNVLVSGPTVNHIAAAGIATTVAATLQKTFGTSQNKAPLALDGNNARLDILKKAGLVAKTGEFPETLGETIPLAYVSLRAPALLNSTEPIPGDDYDPPTAPADLAEAINKIMETSQCTPKTEETSAAAAEEEEAKPAPATPAPSKTCPPRSAYRRRSLARSLSYPTAILAGLAFLITVSPGQIAKRPGQIATFFIESSQMKQTAGFASLGLGCLTFVGLVVTMWAYCSMARHVLETGNDLSKFSTTENAELLDTISIFGVDRALFAGVRLISFILSLLGFLLIAVGVLFPTLHKSDEEEEEQQRGQTTAQDEEYNALLNDQDRL